MANVLTLSFSFSQELKELSSKGQLHIELITTDTKSSRVIAKLYSTKTDGENAYIDEAKLQIPQVAKCTMSYFKGKSQKTATAAIYLCQHR